MRKQYVRSVAIKWNILRQRRMEHPYSRPPDSSDHVLNIPRPLDHRSSPVIGCFFPLASKSFCDMKPHSTHRNRPPAEYCVME